MKLTSASKYSLEALLYLLEQNAESPVRARDIAKAKHLPEGFLLKSLGMLERARLVQSRKGPGGGFRLARPADRISLLEVIEAVDGPIQGHVPAEAVQKSGLERQLEGICDQAADQLRRLLSKVKLSDLSSGKDGKSRTPARRAVHT